MNVVGFLRGQLTNLGSRYDFTALRRNQFAPMTNRRSRCKTAIAQVKRR